MGSRHQQVSSSQAMQSRRLRHEIAKLKGELKSRQQQIRSLEAEKHLKIETYRRAAEESK